jgi:hypothetical protein
MVEPGDRGLAFVAAPEELLQESTLAGMAVVDVSLDRLRRKKDCQFRIGEIPWR